MNAVAEEIPTLQLGTARMQLAEYARQVHYATPTADTTIDDLKRPAYWAHVAQMLKPGDKIEVLAEDNSFHAELLVLSTSRMEAHVHLLSESSISSTDRNAAKQGRLLPYKSEFKGNQLKWCVIRREDKEIVRDGFGTQDQADGWIKDRDGVEAR